jgi:hypothetical protein
MKPRHIPYIRSHARAILHACRIHVGQNFFTISQEQTGLLLEEANRLKYRQPKNANGSRARYFHDKLQREAVMKEKE